MRSRYTRRSRVVFEATGEGSIPADSSLASTNASMGLRTACRTAGTDGRRIGANDHGRERAGDFDPAGASIGHAAPSSIQRLMSCVSVAASGSAGGMTIRFPSAVRPVVMGWYRRLGELRRGCVVLPV